jgi:hypothetical protein
MCQYGIIPSAGCCEKCLAWPIDEGQKKRLVEIAMQALSNAASNPVQQQTLQSDYANMRITAHYQTLNNLINKSFSEAYQRGDATMIEKIMHPIANYYGDVEMDDVIDIGVNENIGDDEF